MEKAIRNKRKYAIQFAKNRTPENMELKRKYRNIATRERRKAIMQYWFAKSEELKSKPREFYNTFRPCINSKTKESTLISLQTEEGIVVQDQFEVAEQLVNYFTTAAASIAGDNVISITEENHDNHGSVESLREVYQGTHFEFNRVSRDEVQKALENNNPNKSCGWDLGAPPKLLKKVACGIAPSLMTLYSSCIELGKWPCAWKMGEWTPVFKKGDRQQAKNYRPITSLVTVNKTFEHMLSKQVTGHYDPTLYQRMTAYRRHHSCQTTLLRLEEDWKSAVDRKELVYILTSDMSKASGSLCHPLIVKKLEAYGFGQNSLNLLRSYFDNRLNRVKIKDVTSDWKRMVLGCP